MRAQGVLDRTGNGAQCGLVQHDIHTFAGAAAGGKIDDVGLEKAVPLPSLLSDCAADLVKVRAIPRRKIVDADHALPEAQEPLEQMRADEAGAAGDEPAQRPLAQTLLHRRERFLPLRARWHYSLQTLTPSARSALASAWHFTSTKSPPGSSLPA